MEPFTLAFVTIGLLLILMALTGSVLKRLPLTTAMLYLAAGFGLGPYGLGLLHLDPMKGSGLLERLTEVAVLISLFTAGLKLRMPFKDPLWRLPVRLSACSMVLTVALIAAVGVYLLQLPLGAAILLGAVLAPTDPVLASDVQVENAADRDRLRFGLTGEAGLNDGTAFPFVMLGLGLLGLHDLGPNGMRWVAVDLVWAVSGGLAIGWLLGHAVAQLVLHLRRKYREAVGLDDFLALGLVALAYGAALLAHTYGFLAVFAAGLALRRVEMQHTGDQVPDDVVAAGEATPANTETADAATDAHTAPAYMAQAVLGFNEQLERIAEVGIVVLLGSMLAPQYLSWDALWFVPLLLLGIRPLAVVLGLLGSSASGIQRRMVAWFGIRGIGSLYYLMYAIQHGLPEPLARRLIGLTLATIAASIIAHGISVTPLMTRYTRKSRPRAAAF